MAGAAPNAPSKRKWQAVQGELKSQLWLTCVGWERRRHRRAAVRRDAAARAVLQLMQPRRSGACASGRLRIAAPAIVAALAVGAPSCGRANLEVIWPERVAWIIVEPGRGSRRQLTCIRAERLTFLPQLITRAGLLQEVKHASTQHATPPQTHHINISMSDLALHTCQPARTAFHEISQRMRTVGARFLSMWLSSCAAGLPGVSMRLSRCLRGAPGVSMRLSRGLRCMAGRWRVSNESRVSRVGRIRGQAGADGQQDAQAAVGDHNIAGGRRDVGTGRKRHKVIAGQVRWRHKVRRQRQHLQRESGHDKRIMECSITGLTCM